ncbi:hypothetical protein PV797_17490 [Clostridiaceae bacterium M8S5]|nr:hypothetical protein PV797_17490 [Clostridiaceae bacterium M8S5]
MKVGNILNFIAKHAVPLMIAITALFFCLKKIFANKKALIELIKSILVITLIFVYGYCNNRKFIFILFYLSILVFMIDKYKTILNENGD